MSAAARTSVATAADVAERPRVRRRAHARRRRLIANVLFVTLMTVVMVYLSVWQRDNQSERNCRHRLQFAATALRRLPPGKPWPLALPQAEENQTNNRLHYDYRPLNDQLLGSITPVGVCACRRPHRLLLREPGLHVLLYDGRNYEIRWLSVPEYLRSAEQWHLATEFPPAPHLSEH